MDKETIEYLLSNYFNEIIWVKENPVIFSIVETIKINGKIQILNREEIYNLKKRLILSIDDINRFLFSEIQECDKNYISYPTNILSKIFNLKSYNKLKTKLDNLTDNNWICTSTKIYNLLFINSIHNIYINDYLDNEIIIGNKSIKVIINENYEEIYFDKSKIEVIKLK